MIQELNGKIYEGEYTIEIPNESTKIDCCWVGLKNSSDITQTTKHYPGKRDIYIPGKDAGFTNILCSMVEHTNHMIVLSSFLLQSGKLTDMLLKKATEGVHIAVLTTGAGKLDMDLTNSDDEEVNKKRIEDHKKLLDTFAGKIHVRMAEHFHSKFILCDPMSLNAAGYLMTCNATVDALNGKNIELAISLSRDEVQSLFAQFQQGFWNEASNELLTDDNKLHSVKNDREFLRSIRFGSIKHPATYKNTNTLKSDIINHILNAKKSLMVSAWSFSHSEILNLLCDKANAGVKVSVYARRSEVNTESLLKLHQAGAKIYGQALLHAKFIISDEEDGIIMTTNISDYGIESGFESGIRLSADDISQMAKVISEIQSGCTQELRTDVALSTINEDRENFCYANGKLFLMQLYDVIQENIKTPFKSPIEMKNYNIRINRSPSPSEKIGKRVNVVLTLKPRKLPNLTTLEMEDISSSNIELYHDINDKSKKYVCVVNWEGTEEAEKYQKHGYIVTVKDI